jgi:hypothetical protein
MVLQFGMLLIIYLSSLSACIMLGFSPSETGIFVGPTQKLDRGNRLVEHVMGNATPLNPRPLCAITVMLYVDCLVYQLRFQKFLREYGIAETARQSFLIMIRSELCLR